MYDLVVKDGASSRTRYFERATILIKYAIMKLVVFVELVTTDNMLADLFTKAVTKEIFMKMRYHMMNLNNQKGYCANIAKQSLRQPTAARLMFTRT